jgi:serine beta-lactamase-like protein LACTB, mitochondrial
MLRYLLFLVLLSSANTLLAQKTDQSSTRDPFAAQQQLLEEGVRNGQYVGVVAGMWRDGAIQWIGGAGHRNVEAQIPADSNTIHRIASIAKPMTAVAIMQLAERGQLDLDASVQAYVPGFPEKKKGVITVRDLLSHGSGIRNYKNEREGAPTEHYATLTDAMAVFQDRRLLFEPGTSYSYATYNYVVLGVIIEAVSGQSYEDYMREHIWEPAGMTSTSVEQAGTAYENKAVLYSKGKDGAMEKAPQTDLSLKIPGGGLQSTVGDLLRFGEAILTDALISRASLEEMIRDTGLKTEGNPYALGWYIYGKADSPSGRIIGHSGSQTGTSSQLGIFLDANLVVAGFSNTTDSWGDLVQLVFQLPNPGK